MAGSSGLTPRPTRGLGRGLAALIPDSALELDVMPTERGALRTVPIDEIRPNPEQPREVFDKQAIAELAASIQAHGLLSPIVVRKMEGRYVVIAGERRLRASKLAGLSQVPVVIRSAEETNREKLEIAIIENIQREDLNAIDRARAFDRLAKEFKLNNAEIGRKIGRSREYVSNSLRLLALPMEIQNGLRTGAIYEGHARALLMLVGRPEEMMSVFRDVMVRKLSVRDVEKITREIAWDRARKRDVKPEIEAMEREFAERLGTKVEIREQEGGGKLIIDFFSADDLVAILTSMKREAGTKTEASASAPVPTLETPPSTTPGDDSFSVERFSI